MKKIVGKRWTEEEINYVQTHAKFDQANRVKNSKSIAEHLDRSLGSVARQVVNLREKSVFPSVLRNGELTYQSYSEHADKRIIHMVRAGRSIKEIADSLGRAERGITAREVRLRKAGVLDAHRKRQWTEAEKEYVIDNLAFDEHGYSTNALELSYYLNKSIGSVYTMIFKLRKQGLVTVHADRTKASCKSKEAHKRFNDMRFAKYKKRVVAK